MEETSTRIACRYCGKELPQEAIFCYYCRRELVTRPERPAAESQAVKLNKWVFLAVIVAIILAIVFFIFL
jgi:hypothetical protein